MKWIVRHRTRRLAFLWATCFLYVLGTSNVHADNQAGKRAGVETVFKARHLPPECFRMGGVEYSCHLFPMGNYYIPQGVSGSREQAPDIYMSTIEQRKDVHFDVYTTDAVYSKAETFAKRETYSRKEVSDLLKKQEERLRKEFEATLERRLADALASFDTELEKLRAQLASAEAGR